ncbi:hypothetical protein ANOM_011878 [Aspergillus nomiae NRRL 13137]|uniref:Uncharacterized protein n=1 Tax=Aspergillus nomiae NRRL (strain ATCC 15546 / NRRL 13137 / CBS 260.88 / M93) TaxID=1509407 RepID=A0A0L1IKV2_ASPN3|nr:hypothetical protein ANOM_011878 [Aspergillus nomiae NRRL 13137]
MIGTAFLAVMNQESYTDIL